MRRDDVSLQPGQFVDGRPKQFCALDGGTLLERTRRRITLAVRPDRQVVVVTPHHAEYFGDLALTMLPGRLVIQPANRGTAAAILYALLTVRNLAGDAPVVVLTLPVAGTGWGDLGSPARVLACLRRPGRDPRWPAEAELAQGA